MLSHDSIVAEEAMRWIDSAGDRWRLQVLSRRVRVLPDGTRKEIPSRIRRFVEGLPWPYVKPAMDYLLSLAPYDGKIANGVDFETEYRPTITLWQRDAQSVVAGPRQSPADATYTLIQDLVENTDRDVYSVGSSSSCSEEAVTDYVWDASDVEEVPAGGQGVTYAVAAVHRNEDGTFDYQLVKRTAKTQHVAETVVRDDNRVRATVELFDNVYTDPEKGYVDETGAPLGVPEPSVVDDGTAVTVTRIDDLLENADCTLKFRVVRETRSRNAEREACEKTIFEHEHTVATPGNASPLGEAPEAAFGVVESHDSRLQEDGTYVNAVGTKTELSVPLAVESWTVTTRGVRHTVTDRNQSVAASAPEFSLASIGTQVENKRTPGGLYDVTTTSPEGIAALETGFECERTVFSETDRSERTDPPGALPADHQEAGGGFTRRFTSHVNEDGTVQVAEQTTEEIEQRSGMEFRRTPRGLVTTVKTRNTRQTAAVPASAGGRQSHEMTPGGLYDLVVTEVSPSAEPDSARCSATVFDHTHDTVVVGAGPVAVQEAEAGGGHYQVITSDMDEMGLVKTVVRDTTELMEGTGKVVERNLHGVVRTVVVRNNVTDGGEPADIGGRVRATTTPGGRHDTEVTVFTPEPAGIIHERSSANYLEWQDETRRHDVGSGYVGIAECTASGALLPTAAEARDSDGTYETSVARRVPSPFRHATVSWTETHRSTHSIREYKVVMHSYRNGTQEEVQELVTDASEGVESVSVSMSINEFGLLDGSVVGRVMLSDVEASGGSGPDFGNAYRGTITVFFDGAKYSVPYETYRNMRGTGSAGFLGSDSCDYPRWGLHSRDSGNSGIKYGEASKIG